MDQCVEKEGTMEVACAEEGGKADIRLQYGLNSFTGDKKVFLAAA
jgi:hypothetical protein